MPTGTKIQKRINQYKLIFIMVLFFGVFGLAKGSQAADYYIAQTAQGDGSGLTDCTHAKAVTWNWTSPNVTAGDTVHLCGTISSQISTHASGTSGSPITILFENGAKISMPTWTSYTGALTVQHNYITVDGGTNGIVEATDNGTQSYFGGTKTYNNYTIGVYVTNAGNVTVKNLTVRTIYDRLANSPDCYQYGNAIKVDGTASSNILIDHNTVSDASLIIYDILSNTSNITVSNNTAVNGGVNINIAPGNPTSTGSNIDIHGNYVTGGSKWDGTWTCSQASGPGTYCSCGDPHVHQDGIHMFSQGINGWVDGIKIYDNYLQDFGTHSTGHIYLEKPYLKNILVYNNVCIDTGLNFASSGFISVGGSANPKVYNNTIIGNYPTYGGNIGINFPAGYDTQSATYIASTNITAENNIVSGTAYAFVYDYRSTFGTVDYNDYYNHNSTPFASTDANGNATGHDWTWWRSQAHDSNGTTANPLLNSDYTATTGTPIGTSLSSIFTTDYAGHTRSLWNMGAYEYSAGSSDTTPPAAPSGLAVN